MSKSIAIIGPAWPFRGGLANFNERLAREWMARGDRATIHTFTKQYPGFLFPGTSQYSDQPAPSGISIERTLHAYNPLQWRTAANKILAQEHDLILIRFWIPAMGPSLGYVAGQLVERSDSRVVALVDNLSPHETRPLDTWLTDRFIRHPHAFITMSNAVAEPLRRAVDGRPVCQTPHPLYDDYGLKLNQVEARNRLGINADAKVLLFFGFIRKYKGLDLLLDALSDDRFRNSNVKVVIAGEWYDDPAPYRATAKRNGLDETILWHDRFIPENEISTFFSAADAVIQPYRNATQSGISALSYAYDKPLISTKVGGLTEIIDDGETGFLCEPEPTSIREAIVRWLNEPDPSKMQEFIHAKRATMTWSRLIGTIESCG